MSDLAVFGVDPGKTTGLCYLHVLPDGEARRVAQVEVSHVDVDPVLGGWLAVAPATWRLVVGCERFTSGKQASKHTAQPHAERVVGTVEALGVRFDAFVHLQQPDDAKSLVTDRVLRRVGWYPRGLPHAADGTRHALLALFRYRASVAERLLYGGDGRPS